MKPLVITGMLLLFTTVSCQKKSVPVIAGRQTGPAQKTSIAYPPASTAAPDTVQGKTVFMARCSRCHGLPDPRQYTAGRWDVILASMLPRARMTNDNALHVRAWVLANAAKQ